MKGSVALHLFVVCGISCVLSGRVEAEDLNPPAWRGEANTCYAVWEFGENTLGEADIWYGPPSGADVTEMGGIWEVGENVAYTEYFESVEGRSGVRAFNVEEFYFDPGISYYIADMLGFRLDNYANDNAEKQIWVQVVWSGLGGAPYLEAAASGSTGEEGVSLGNLDLGDGWTHSTYEMVLQPNPVEETVFLTGGGFAASYLYVDQVIIDTRCVPEPSTVIMLAMGALGILTLGHRRRRAAYN